MRLDLDFYSFNIMIIVFISVAVLSTAQFAFEDNCADHGVEENLLEAMRRGEGCST